MRKIKMELTLQVEDDMQVPTFGVAVFGLPETGDETPEEKLVDKISDTISNSIKEHNESVFKGLVRG